MYVCLCEGITDTQIREAVNGGAESVREVKERLGASSQCGKCAGHVRDIVKNTLEDTSSRALFYNVA